MGRDKINDLISQARDVVVAASQLQLRQGKRYPMQQHSCHKLTASAFRLWPHGARREVVEPIDGREVSVGVKRDDGNY